MERWTTLARDRLDASALKKPEKRQPLCVVVQVPAVSVHEEPFYVSTSRHFRSLSQILSQLAYHRWVNTAAELFPQATQILDRFHTKEHLSKVGKAIYGDRAEGKAMD